MLRGKRIVLGVTGSIAAYKAVAVASALTQAGALVDVVMTPERERADPAAQLPGDHPSPGRGRDVRHAAPRPRSATSRSGTTRTSCCIAPATAHTLAKLALGLADDLVTTTCPGHTGAAGDRAGHGRRHVRPPRPQANVGTLRERGAIIVEPGDGRMASGWSGRGRLAEPAVIVDTLRIVLARTGDLAGWRVVVTAGGTQEAIDPVRYISNRSSGKMGYAVAEAARDRGASVVLVTAPTALTRAARRRGGQVVSAAEMHQAVMRGARRTPTCW